VRGVISYDWVASHIAFFKQLKLKFLHTETGDLCDEIIVRLEGLYGKDNGSKVTKNAIKWT